MSRPPAPFDDRTGSWSSEAPADAAAVAARQLERAWEIVERAAAENAYYRDRLGALPEGRTPDDWATLPRSTKSEVVADCSDAPPYGRRWQGTDLTTRSVVETSGTSGRGRAVFPLGSDDERLVHETEAIGFWWAGVGPGSKVHLTFPVGVTAAARWYDAGLRLLGANVIHVGTYSTDKKLELLGRYGGDTLIGTPTYVHRLGLAAVDAGIDPRSFGLSALVVAGERYTQRWAEEIQETWGALLYEQYGCTERAIAWTCPGGVLRDGAWATLHFPADAALCEVVDPDTGRPVESGETGELVVTPFAAAASPLIRYRTGDRVELVGAGECPCGRPLPGIRPGRVERYDNMMKIRGVNIWPESFDPLVFGVSGVADYRGVVTVSDAGNEELIIEVECPAADAGRVRQEIAVGIRRSLGLGVTVEVHDPGALALRVPEGFVKVARWRDDRARARG